MGSAGEQSCKVGSWEQGGGCGKCQLELAPQGGKVWISWGQGGGDSRLCKTQPKLSFNLACIYGVLLDFEVLQSSADFLPQAVVCPWQVFLVRKGRHSLCQGSRRSLRTAVEKRKLLPSKSPSQAEGCAVGRAVCEVQRSLQKGKVAAGGGGAELMPGRRRR